MKIFSRAVLLPLAQVLPGRERALDQLLELPSGFDGTAILALIGSVVFAVLAYWIAAGIVAPREQATFKNALKIWGLTILAGIVVAITCGIAIPIAVLSGNRPAVAVVLIGALVLALGLLFALPVKVLEISPLRALGFWPIALILMFAAQTGLDQILGRPPLREWSSATGFLRSNVTGGGTAALDAQLDKLSGRPERQKSFSERQAALRSVFTQLQERQRNLPANDPVAVATYERQLARYEDLLRVLRADYASAQAQAGP